MSKQTPRSKSPVSKKETAVAGAVENPEFPESITENKNVFKEKTPEERAKIHREDIMKTVVSTILGILSGIILFLTYGTGEKVIWYGLLAVVIALTYYVQRRLIYPVLRIDAKGFGFKDWFYVEFMVVDFCLVVWTLLLN